MILHENEYRINVGNSYWNNTKKLNLFNANQFIQYTLKLRINVLLSFFVSGE